MPADFAAGTDFAFGTQPTGLLFAIGMMAATAEVVVVVAAVRRSRHRLGCGLEHRGGRRLAGCHGGYDVRVEFDVGNHGGTVGANSQM